MVADLIGKRPRPFIIHFSITHRTTLRDLTTYYKPTLQLPRSVPFIGVRQKMARQSDRPMTSCELMSNLVYACPEA
jgi:hypothetical protein